ncbi:hypothetical protein EGM87_02820 [Sphingobium sp. RSMS]|uniref:hypothetical protein n=1 Tax=Sphingobium sp. RSMS TaxID=520734 RepID=UPI0010F6470E|nr:hypothetical protein [Sphingobium sp. RSMS]UXC91434.1 hypothetical protein EGM87_02820 [Sphingobium sp. RSMS]
MTRQLHVETKVQRGDHPSDQQREHGYEPRDASPGKVMLGIACFLGLMLVGLAFAAGTLRWLRTQDDQPRDLAPVMVISPPLPHLLAEPQPARRRYDAAMERHLKNVALTRARRRIIERGWGELEPASLPETVARPHREAAR